jgi:hypothetical protein
MNTVIHPSIFFVPANCRYRSFIDSIAKSFENEYSDIFKCVGKIPDLDDFVPSFETVETYRMKDIDLGKPYVLSFIDLDAGRTESNITFVRELITRISDINSQVNNRNSLVNIFIRNLSRKVAYQSDDSAFYSEYEKVLCGGSNAVYNITVDRFHENDDSSISKEQVFDMLRQQLRLLLIHDRDTFIQLNHCDQPVLDRERESPVRYNSAGSVVIGFNMDEVTECISLKRKSDCLQKLVSGELPEDQSLETTRRSQTFFNRHFKDLDKYAFKSKLSFEDEISNDFTNFRNEQKECNSHLDKNKLDIGTKSFLKKIDSGAESFKNKLKTEEENIIKQKRETEKQLNASIESFAGELFSSYSPDSSLFAAIYGLESLLKPKELHLVTRQDSQPPETLTEKISEMERRINTSHSEDTDKMEEIKKSIRGIDSQIAKKYDEIEGINRSIELKFCTKNFVNIWFLLVGGTVVFLALPFLYGLFVCDDTATVTDQTDSVTSIHDYIKSIFKIAGILCAVTGLYRIWALKNKLKTARKKLEKITGQKMKEFNSYIGTYHSFFNSIIQDIRYRQLKKMLDGNIAFVKQRIGQIKSFRRSLEEMQKSFRERYDAFNFSKNIWTLSIIGKAEIEYFCEKNPFLFPVEQRSVYDYFRQFVENSHFFDTEEIFYTLRDADVINKVSNGEEIKANQETYNDNYVYAEIDRYELTTYLGDEISFNAVKQGQLGDCYFLATLAAIANKKPGYIRKIIDGREDGGPAVCFYDDLLQTHKIYVDKKFWIDEKQNPVYAQYGLEADDKREIWAMLIEKAWAKINGLDYTNINGGDVGHKIDYSLALTGRKAIREYISPEINIDSTLQRIRNHIQNKPVVFYSVKHKNEHSAPELVEFHAYALTDISPDNKYGIYNPHGNMLYIEEKDIQFNFGTVLYFDFNESEDRHLSGLFSEYFIRNTDNTLLSDLDKAIHTDISDKIENLSLEDILSGHGHVFNIMLDGDKRDSFVDSIIRRSIPFVPISGAYEGKPVIYFIGKNELLQNLIKQKLSKEGIDDSIQTLSCNNMEFGLLRLRNNLKLENVSGM